MRHARPSLRPLALGAALAALLVSLPRPAAGSEPRLFVLTDPEKDDHGDGNLRYPVRSSDGLVPGALDIVSFSARNVPDGTWLEVTFARPVPRTERRPVDGGGTLLSDVARLGFHALNLDVYIDRDRAPGSGNTRMLPGRNAEVDPDSGWERAVCLTPYPKEAEALLKKTLSEEVRKETLETRTDDGRLTAAEKAEIKRAVGLELSGTVFFPTRVEVRNRLVRFFVPAPFLGGPAKAEWGWIVASSGAAPAGQVDLLKIAGLRKDAPLEPLFIMRATPTASAETFGGADEDDPNPPALVDVIVPSGGPTQEKLLAGGNPRARLLPKLPAVVPAASSAR